MDKFVPGETPITVALQVTDDTERDALIEVAREGQFAAGKRMRELERRLAGKWHAIVVNSGSSANLLAMATLTSQKFGNGWLEPGDEVITAACGFPTTLAPIIQMGLVPVFIDTDLPTYNPSPDRIERAIGPRTRAVFLAHMLGNPFEADAIFDICKRHHLWLIEDCCDAMGAEYGGRSVGAFGVLATQSFYPAHHVSMGEGGAVLTPVEAVARIVRSLRDWGRDCTCEPGCENTCGRRFGQQFGTLPQGYDHKYVYTDIGYNLKATEMQAAIGLAQLDKLSDFVFARRLNFQTLWGDVAGLEEFFVLPEATANSMPSWFGFPLCIRKNGPFSRQELIRFLDNRKIGVRMMFGGNLTRQPAFMNAPQRVAESLPNTDDILYNGFWLGIHPGLTDEMIRYMADSLREFCEEGRRC